MRQLATVILLLSLSYSIGQDLHFSQFYASPLHLNPGLTGTFDFDFKDKDIRLTSIFRQQWSTIQTPYFQDSKPFNTIIASVDGLVKHHKALDGNYVGLGLFLYQDQAGDLNYTNQYYTLSGSYGYSLTREHDAYVSPGISLSYGRNIVDFSRGFFDNQWNGTAFDPSLPTGEIFPDNSRPYYDLSMGVSFSLFPFKRKKHTFGFAVMHINEPDQNFYTDNVSTLNRKYVGHYEGQYPLSHHRELVPLFLFHTQARVYEATGGGMLKFNLRNVERRDIKNIQAGFAYRMVGNWGTFTASDGLVVLTRMRYRNYLFGFAYDANFSGLTQATNTVGAFEFSVVYYADLYKRNREPKKRLGEYKPVCPDE